MGIMSTELRNWRKPSISSSSVVARPTMAIGGPCSEAAQFVGTEEQFIIPGPPPLDPRDTSHFGDDPLIATQTLRPLQLRVTLVTRAGASSHR